MVLNIRVILLRFDECHHSVFPDGEIDDCEDIYSHEGKYYDPNGYISHLGEVIVKQPIYEASGYIGNKY